MKKKTVNRRDFLQKTGALLTGIICLPLGRLLRWEDTPPKNTLSPKEAKYYTQGDNLAG